MLLLTFDAMGGNVQVEACSDFFSFFFLMAFKFFAIDLKHALILETKLY